ncbi:hypothetical protein ORV05_16625 [Amycolatopsis cynarae]|uniref:Uncharacterized protein n=1 Tax=Amycolatopsis cynarae TaxID=2995223 RepID=A0ABY7BD24_9PSEU|nr:hypothetical protein [Amycolatopsis sp. HUAS 11-8]WAL69324.1 hypothetical protein ORV05_16625 [Amycolatopsis sp. HUAS 11-8]
MDLTVDRVARTGAARARGMPSALTVLGGTVISLIGLTWDVQWHSDVGPDTFFTVPHLFLYSGSAISGIASLVMVLAATAAQRRGSTPDPAIGGRAVRTLGIFAAPLGYLVSGTGAASFLLYGLWDQWWHGLYGFDAVINSPPHIGLLLSISITMVGTVMVFAAARQWRWGRAGTLAALSVLLAFSTVTVLGLQDLNGVVSWIDAGTGFLSVLIVLIAAGFLGRPGGALVTAFGLAVIQAVFWWFSPWAARAYAGAVGLPVRDYVREIPEMPSLMPMCLLVVAAVVEGLLWWVRSRPPAMRWAAVLAGGAGALIVAVCAPFQSAWVTGRHLPEATPVLATAVAGAVLGLLAGFLGHRFGRMLRLLSPAEGR